MKVIRSSQLKIALAETVGTFILLVVGHGMTMGYALGGGKLTDFTGVVAGWGLLVWLLVSALYHASGGHLNPAVSISFWSVGLLSLSDFFVYAVSQMAGAFLGTAFSFHLYEEALSHFAGGVRAVSGANASAALWAAFPPAHISNYTAFLSSLVGTALLLFCALSIVDPRNQVPKFMHAPAIGAAVSLCCFAFVLNAGVLLNPAVDFGPRLFMLSAGYGMETFSAHNYFAWVPLVGPMVGGVCGAWLYKVAIGAHLPELPEERTPERIPFKK